MSVSSSTSGASSSSGKRAGYRTSSSAAAAAASATAAETSLRRQSHQSKSQHAQTPAHPVPPPPSPLQPPRPSPISMPELFSPPLSLSQTQMAEAGEAALSHFKVPTFYDPVFSNQPDSQSVMVHSCASTYKNGGFQAIIVLHPKSDVPSHLGLSAAESAGPSSSSSSEQRAVAAVAAETTAFIMSSSKNQPFVMYKEAPKAAQMQLTVTEYLTLVNFFASEWPRLRSKLLLQTSKMREGLDPLPVTSHLVFYSHGVCRYSASLSSRLAIKVKADSRKPADNDECLSAWLELYPLPSQSSSGGGRQEFDLPLSALSTLASDSAGLKTLTDLVTAYKNRSRKRSKPVA